jgi:hypothetical protein
VSATWGRGCSGACQVDAQKVDNARVGKIAITDSYHSFSSS